jgi:PAS domain-containing protein
LFLWQLLGASPVLAFTLCVCLATIFWCIRFIHRRRKGWDRFLAALIGVVAICQGIRLLRQAGVISAPGSYAVDQFADLMVTGLYMISLLILRFSAMERKTAEVRLRLVEANDQTPVTRVAGLEGPAQSVYANILGSIPLAMIAMDRPGRVTYWNSAAERLLGWTSNEVVGKASPLPLSTPIRTKSGALVRGESWVSALRDSAGRPCGTLLMIEPLGAEEQRETERVAVPEVKPSFAAKHFVPAAGA